MSRHRWPAAAQRLRASRMGNLSYVLGGLALVGLVATVAAGLLFGDGGNGSPAPPGTEAGVPEAGAGRAPDFSVRDIDGRTFSLAEQRGGVVVLDFLEAGCPTCALQVPVLDEVATRFAASGVTVMIVDLSGLDDRGLRDYYRGQYGAGEEVLIAADRGFRVARAFQLTEMTAFVIGPQGEIVWQGTPTRDVLDREIRGLL